MFSDFWIGEGKDNVFWSKQEAVEYWQTYSDHFDVSSHLQFNQKVKKVTAQGRSGAGKDGWIVELDSGVVAECDHLVLAIGNNQTPSYPDWKDAVTDIEFSHVKTYINAEKYKDKRVLIIGGGESASDVANEVSRVAKHCWVSLRNSTGWVVPRKREGVATDISSHRGMWTLPVSSGNSISKTILEKEKEKNDPVYDAVVSLNELVNSKYGIRGIYGTKTLALAEAIAHHGCEVVSGVKQVVKGGSEFELNDGSVLKAIDAIIFCTGYKNNIPFLPEQFRTTDPRSLYKHMFNPITGDRITWLGMARPGFGSQFPIMEMQARLSALIIAGEHQLPSATMMEKVASSDRAHYLEVFQENGQRIRSLVDYFYYMDDVARLIGCTPPLKKYFFLHPKLWMHLVYGPTQATQFRLRGPGRKIKVAHEILHKLPISNLNTIVKAGIWGRIKYSYRLLVPKLQRI
jgi:dimethylaniline monooxygenase (N-oxide forming)